GCVGSGCDYIVPVCAASFLRDRCISAHEPVRQRHGARLPIARVYDCCFIAVACAASAVPACTTTSERCRCARRTRWLPDPQLSTRRCAMRLETIAVHGGYTPEATTKAVAVPIYQTTSYAFDNTQHGAD